MPNSDINLNFFTKSYKIFYDKSLIILDIQGNADSNFHFQIGFILKNSQKIDFNFLESKLKACITSTNNHKNLFFNDKLKFLSFLLPLFELDSKSTKIIQIKKNKEYFFKINEERSKVVQDFDKNLSDLFITDSFQNKHETFYLGYEKPKNITGNNAPLFYALIYSGEKLSKKLFLFPTNSQCLKSSVFMLKNESALDPLTLGIPYVEYIPQNSTSNSNYDKDIQTRINLQTIISEILTHLEKPKCFRKNGSEKADIFKNLAKSIASGEALGNISSQFNAHDTWKLLAQHRDPWGFLSFFKGKTHSLIAWEALRDETSNFASSSHTQALSS